MSAPPFEGELGWGKHATFELLTPIPTFHSEQGALAPIFCGEEIHQVQILLRHTKLFI
jgi:hypothetical protein